MPQADPKNTAPAQEEQIHAAGYVVDEFHDLLLGDVATGLNVIAELCAQPGNTLPDLNGNDWAAIMRVFARQVQQIREQALFTFDASARPRDLH